MVKRTRTRIVPESFRDIHDRYYEGLDEWDVIGNPEDDIEPVDSNPYLQGDFPLYSKKKMAKRGRRTVRRSRKGVSAYQRFVGAFIRRNHRSGMQVTNLMKRAAAAWRGKSGGTRRRRRRVSYY